MWRSVRPDLGPVFATPIPPAVETRCRSFPKTSSSAFSKRITFDFAPLELGANVRGARVAERERRVSVLSDNELMRPLARRANHITQCWKWFAATHPGTNTDLDLYIVIDEFGATSDVTIQNKPDDVDLAACIRGAFAAPLYLYRARGPARIVQTVHFERAEQPPWRKLPARPTPITSEPLPERGTQCVRVVPGVIDDVRLPWRTMVSDFDTARIPPPPPVKPGELRRHIVEPPALRIGCVASSPIPRKAYLLAAFRSNWGALEQCHADARARMPDLAGELRAKLWFDAGGGEPPLAQVTGVGDGELHACIDRALEEIWIAPPQDGSIEINLTFTLVPYTPTATTEREWRDELDTASTPRAVCHVWNALVKERLTAVPWIDDARIRAAFAAIARFIAVLPAADATTCLAMIQGAVTAYVGIDDKTVVYTSNERRGDVDRLETLLPLATIATWGPRLRWVLADQWQYTTAHASDARTTLQELKADPNFGDLVRLPGEVPVNNSCAL